MKAHHVINVHDLGCAQSFVLFVINRRSCLRNNFFGKALRKRSEIEKILDGFLMVFFMQSCRNGFANLTKKVVRYYQEHVFTKTNFRNGILRAIVLE